jgi:hypothetical protein
MEPDVQVIAKGMREPPRLLSGWRRGGVVNHHDGSVLIGKVTYTNCSTNL